MDSQFLESFVTVVDSGSIAEAARRLNLTAAGVAQRIRALEREFGARLVFRSGRSVRATEAGTAILAQAGDLLRRIRDLKSLASVDEPAGELRLGAIHTVQPGILPDLLSLMMNNYPRIKVDILQGGSHELYSKLLNDEVDAAIIAEPPFTIPKTCGWRVWREEPLVVLAPASTSVRNPLKLLASEPFIRMERKSWAGRLVDGYLRHVGIRPLERFEIYTQEAIAGMVNRGLGVSLVPDWAPPWPSGLSLLKLPVPTNPFARRVGLIWTKASVRSRLVRAVLELAPSIPALAWKGGATRKVGKQKMPRGRGI
jgi:DNA-binding transcriptional LysR family regulator